MAPITVTAPVGYDMVAESKMSDGKTIWRKIDMNGDLEQPLHVTDNDALIAGTLDLNEVSGNKLGWHQGKTTQNGKEIDYTFVNQPYSYGMLTAEGQADPMVRTVETQGGKKTIRFWGGYYSSAEMDKLTENQQLSWFDFQRATGKQEFTYQGGVIARAIGMNGEEIVSPRYDGQIKFTADLNRLMKGKTKEIDISGEIDSKMLGGKIYLKTFQYSPMYYIDHKVSGYLDIAKEDNIITNGVNTRTDFAVGKFNSEFFGHGGYSDVAGDATLHFHHYINPTTLEKNIKSEIDGKKLTPMRLCLVVILANS